MIALWDTKGTEVVKALSAERRTAGGVASGLALTLIAVVDEVRVREAETAAATAAAAHPCRLLIVVRRPDPVASGESRLDAEIVVGGRLGPAEAVVLHMSGRLSLHPESVVIPLLAPDVPVVTWWHQPPPESIATDPLGVLAERRITDVAQADDPLVALHVRAADYAPGDTDLAWTRATPWRTLVACTLDPVPAGVESATVTATPGDPSAALVRGWLQARLGLTPTMADAEPGGIAEIVLRLSDRSEIAIAERDGVGRLRRTGLPERAMPLLRRQLGEQLAEELRRLGADQPYADALACATGVTGLHERPATRVHVWYDPAPVSA
ncbi:MAG: glucose-6-phosphate dehydrogenase assembly protein OpcA [Micromonosporaceae bacterium]